MSHPKTEAIRTLLAAGLSNTAIAQRLGVSRPAVGRIRRAAGILNVADAAKARTPEEHFHQYARPAAGGHMEWTGPTYGRSDTPVIRRGDQRVSPTRVAFRLQYGAEPVGQVFAGCGMRHCVAPDHMDDMARRQRDRAALRLVLGTAERVERCGRAGHDQAVHGRFLPNGSAYCLACKTADKQHRAA